MNILLTSSRAPVTLELIRVFGRAGHSVYATDSIPWTLGSHSRYLARHVVTPPPRYDSAGFARALLRVIDQERIDWLIPTCEEVFYVARHHAELAARTRVCTEPLATLALLHHKGIFQRCAASLGLRTPRTTLVRDLAELRARLAEFPAYLLKPAYSRFAMHIVTNRGPRAGWLPLHAVRPTPAQPWLLQEYIDGESICTYSTLHAGHVTAHCAYATPYKVDHGSGARFETIDGAETLAIVRRLGAALRYTGQMSLDFIRAADRLYLLECNPRATSGLHLFDPDQLIGGLTDPCQPTWVAPPGRQRQLTLVLLADAARRLPHRQAPLRDLVGVRDVIFDRADPLPALVQLRMAAHFAARARRKRMGLTAATTDEIEWNGEP
jgi:predicted ATP-grasp superfamily ATP-dependent carboligase